MSFGEVSAGATKVNLAGSRGRERHHQGPSNVNARTRKYMISVSLSWAAAHAAAAGPGSMAARAARASQAHWHASSLYWIRDRVRPAGPRPGTRDDDARRVTSPEAWPSDTFAGAFTPQVVLAFKEISGQALPSSLRWVVIAEAWNWLSPCQCSAAVGCQGLINSVNCT